METVEAILQEFRSELNTVTVTVEVASAGIEQFVHFLNSKPLVEANPDPMIRLGTGPPDDPESRQYGSIRQSEVLAMTRTGGAAPRFLGNMWLVYVYSLWEHRYRGQLATAFKCSPRDITHPILGDLRHLRHDILHHDGVATAGHSGKCVALAHWVRVGLPIYIWAPARAELVERFPWSDLRRRPDGPDPVE